jgi:hypothetical protein
VAFADIVTKLLTVVPRWSSYDVAPAEGCHVTDAVVVDVEVAMSTVGAGSGGSAAVTA